jgi:hypothetical protein
MLRLSLAAAVVTTMLAGAANAHAQASDSRFAVSGNIGTPGVGAELQYKLNDQFVVRGGGDWMNFNYNHTYSGIDYDAKLKTGTGGVFLDWHPGQGGFFVSGGSYFGERKARLAGTPTGPTQIGEVTFTPAQIGTITGDVEMSKTQPFVGLGYDNTFIGDSRWGFRVLGGVSFSDRPKVDLRASGGTLSNDPTFLAQLQEEEDNVRADAKGFKYFPIVQVGLSYRF